MGKVKTINPEKQEQLQKEKAQKEAERLAKIEAAKSAGKAKNPEESSSVISNLPTSGEKSNPNKEIAASQPPHNEVQKDSETIPTLQNNEEAPKKKKTTSKYAAKQKGKNRARSENYQKALHMVDKAKLYSVKEALELLDKTHLAKFDETVELHINTMASGLSGQVVLPHGTGKTVRVAILQPSKDATGAEELLKKIEAGKIEFDILVATPDAMPKLARVAKILGPRGLMPNPKAGTVTANPDVVAKSYAGGQMYYKTEAKTPIIHVAVGKMSFGAEKLAQNIENFLKAVKMENIKKVTVKSTMSPGIRLLVK